MALPILLLLPIGDSVSAPIPTGPAAEDIRWHLSTKSGAAGFTLPSTPAASLGKYLSTSAIADGALFNLFRRVTGDEVTAEARQYRCFFVRNAHATATLYDAKIWIESQDAGGGLFALGLDPEGVVAEDQAGAQAEQIANGETAPAGIIFTGPTTAETALEIGNIGPGETVAIWGRLAVDSAASARAFDSASLILSGGAVP